MRFSSFSDEWTTSLLKDSASFYKGTGISKEELSEEGHPCILYGELYTTYKTEKIKDVKSKTSLPTEKLVKSKANDVIIPASGETPIDIATACCIMNDDILLGGDLNIIRIKKHNGVFLSCQLNGKRKLDIAKIAQGASIVHLHNDDLKKLKCYYPKTLCEEEKIVAFLSKIDERISTQSKIIDKLKSQMNYIIDNIIDYSAPQFQFKDLYINAGEGGTPLTSNNLYYENGSIPFIKIEDLSNKYLNENKDFITEQGLKNSSAWIIPKNSIIYSNGATIGRISINTYPVCTKQGILGIIPSRIVLTEYLYYFLRSIYFRKQVHRITVKGTMDCAYLKDLNFIKCYIPALERQEKIIKSLRCLDEKILLEETILNKLKEQKKFLLSNMFI